MPLYLDRRASGIWRIRGVHHGVRVDRSAKTRVRAEAEAVRERIERQIFDGAVLGKAPARLFADAALGYMRGGGERRYLAPILRSIGETPLDDLSQGLIDATAARLYPNARPSTINRQVYTPISAVLAWAAADGLTRPRRIRRPKQPPGRIDWRTPSEIEALIAACSPAFADLVIWYVGTGMRASEALALDWRDVSPRGERVTLWDTKSGHARSIDVQPRARQALPPRAAGRVWASWAARHSVAQGLKRAARRAGVEPLGPHVLRHTWATWAYASTLDLTYVMTQGGWRSAALALRYAHTGSPDVAEEAARFGWRFGQYPGSRTARPTQDADK